PASKGSVDPPPPGSARLRPVTATTAPGPAPGPQPTIGRSYGSWTIRSRERTASAAPSVIGPSRPTYMHAVSTHFASSGRAVVIPVLSPTVPKADSASNSTWSNV